jgi:hypothetical protein
LLLNFTSNSYRPPYTEHIRARRRWRKVQLCTRRLHRHLYDFFNLASNVLKRWMFWCHQSDSINRTYSRPPKLFVDRGAALPAPLKFDMYISWTLNLQ